MAKHAATISHGSFGLPRNDSGAAYTDDANLTTNAAVATIIAATEHASFPSTIGAALLGLELPAASAATTTTT